MRGRPRKLLLPTGETITEEMVAEEMAKSTKAKPKKDENRLTLASVPEPLMEWIRKMAEESFRTPEGFVLFTLTGCMKKNLENGGKAS